MDKYKKERQESATAMLQHGKSVHDWEARIRDEELAEGGRARNKRKESIERKLIDMGYQASDFPPKYDYNWRRLLEQPRELSSRIWKQIQPKLVAAIALEKEQKVWAERGVRIDLRRQEVRTLYQLYIEDIEDDEVLLPGSVEFTYLPEVTALVSRDDGLIEVTQERFMDVVAEAMTTFNISERAKLANLLREPAPRCTDYDSSDEDDDTISRTPMEIACDLEVLNRATSILTCYRCSLSSPTSYFPFTGITRHILKFHPDSSYKAISREKAVIGTASAVLEMLGLPSSTRYSDISRKIVCLCGKPDFQQPAEFSELIMHIFRENIWYIQALRSP
ncbi:hypothetical protein EW026_g187 [Hermanssonia centrifuga]|uniref:Uncharacterized protein n=1 Tax=Hermanssonia centrifuga TaxID=98765 RepID=A0A4S4KV57_9APHY|nr:hypothetical protein EW026_g187 [Hermanssonia centrifuga]